MEELENEISTQEEENTVSLASAQALADALTKIEAYTPTTWVDNSSPDIDAEHLNKPEQAIKRVTDALNSAVDVIKDLQSQVTKNSGAISDVNNNLSNANSQITQLYSKSYVYFETFAGEQNTNTDAVKNKFMSLPNGSAYILYNSSGLEWGYLMIKSPTGKYGCILRISSQSRGVQYISYTSTTWGTWKEL